MKKYIPLLFIIFFTGCSSLLFHPNKKMNPVNIDYFEVDHKIITTKIDNDILYGWHLKTDKKRKGTIVFLHGNAGNISSHIWSVIWFPWHGYDVISFDYRGYGNSTGEPSIDNIHKDVKAIFDWSIKNTPIDEKLYIFGQSLGGVVSTTTLANYKDQNRFSSIIIDSAFSSYKDVAEDVLKKNWFTSPFLSFSQKLEFPTLDPINNIQNIHISKIILHGKKDEIVDFKHSLKLYEKAKTPKSIWLKEDAIHIGLFLDKKSRLRLIDLLENYKEIDIR